MSHRRDRDPFRDGQIDSLAHSDIYLSRTKIILMGLFNYSQTGQAERTS